MLKTYMSSLQVINNCQTDDFLVKKSFEKLNYYEYSQNHGKICNGSFNITRIGCAHFVGVAHDNYYKSSTQRVSSGDVSKDSHENVVAAIREFQHRSIDDKSVAIIFLSCVWDIVRKRYVQPHQTKYNFLREYRVNYTSLMTQVIPILRQKDTLVLQTQHTLSYQEGRIGSAEIDLAKSVNDEIRKIAIFFGLPVFEEERLLGPDTKKYLTSTDGIHQSRPASDVIALSLSNRCWNILNENRDKCDEIQRSWLNSKTFSGNIIKGMVTGNSKEIITGKGKGVITGKSENISNIAAFKNIDVDIKFALRTDLFTSFCEGKGSKYDVDVGGDEKQVRVKGILRLPILLVCGHPGPCSDMLWLLKQSLNISDNDIDVLGYYMAGNFNHFKGERKALIDSRKIKSNSITESISIHDWYSVNSTKRNAYIAVAEIYPTIICEFPANECVGFQPVAKKLIIRFSHRWYHHAITSTFKEWIRHDSFSKVVLAANNPFDIYHIKMYLGLDAKCIPSMYGNMLDIAYTPTRSYSDLLLLPHHSGGISYNSNASYLRFVTSHLSNTTKLKIAAEFLRKPKFDYVDLGKFVAGVVLPYASHTSSINEAYSIGIPLFIPSPALVANWHISRSNSLNCGIFSCGIMTHMRIGNNRDSFSSNLFGKATNEGNVCNIEKNASASCIADWISYSDFYNFPYVKIFDSWNSLEPLINNYVRNRTQLLSESSKSRRWVKNIIASASQVLLTNLLL